MASESRFAAWNVLSLTASVAAVAAFVVWFFGYDSDEWLVVSALAIVVAVVSAGVSLALAARHDEPRRSATALLGLGLLLMGLAIIAVVWAVNNLIIE